jgi:hypothetical protein
MNGVDPAAAARGDSIERRHRFLVRHPIGAQHCLAGARSI